MKTENVIICNIEDFLKNIRNSNVQIETPNESITITKYVKQLAGELRVGNYSAREFYKNGKLSEIRTLMLTETLIVREANDALDNFNKEEYLPEDFLQSGKSYKLVAEVITTVKKDGKESYSEQVFIAV